ncbi:nucleotidyltransferase [Acetilactobacillus jinshanensis]|uniref:tRNA(Met) cytidine acetate ligase n=1 Tax=Acetilactobacillus jinshanensis TaxID=1720083 RepID=A0A4P6ZM29_9LACO|nr:nucleotidyltransferase [Acetilactobacillus jinshanensis]QBP18663.1 nucleotidyltransferase [Acetilactobacillus jinshanensis]URL61539.1 nucleotidyltransferase [uncultured bacterium]
MLNAVGIIAEFNPLHNGHRYLIKRAQQTTNADLVVVVMSGNWVQRGIPAIVDKWQRTQMALAAGADLVIELPVQFVVQPADIFAFQAVKLVKQLDCQWLAFGCEHSNWDFDHLAQIKVSSDHQAFQNYRATYATLIRQNFYQQTGLKITGPNDLLALNYARAKRSLEASFKLKPILRSSGHNDKVAEQSSKYVSSAVIRRSLFNDHNLNSVSQWMPKSSIELMQQPWFNWNTFWPLLRYRIIESSLADLQSIYEMREGLEHRLKQGAIQSKTFKEFIQFIKTKRYTYSTLLRLCFYVLIGLTKTDWKSIKTESYLRILGFDKKGRQYLNQIKKQVMVPIITNVTKDALNKYLEWDFRAGMLFQMESHHYEDLYQHPIIK